jgi:putative flippase GtrA
MPESKAPPADFNLHTLRRVHKTALGCAVGVMAGVGLFLLTAVHVALGAAGPDLSLLNQYFAGYSVSWPGAIVGLAWGLTVGFIAGWLLGFVHNFTMSFWVFIVRTRNDLSRTRNFLDHL